MGGGGRGAGRPSSTDQQVLLNLTMKVTMLIMMTTVHDGGD